jgi:hypothetical protein
MKKLALLVIVGSLATVAIWSWKRTAEPADAASRLLTDRIWLDRLPRSERDAINVFGALSKESVGIFQAASQWRGSYEVFRFEASGGELRLVYPQSGARETVQARARRCSEQKMDFCLELEGASRGVKKYYSKEGWEIGQAHDLDGVKRRIDAVRGQLQAAD